MCQFTYSLVNKNCINWILATILSSCKCGCHYSSSVFNSCYRDASLKQFASLAISGSGHGSGGGDCPTLLLQYLSSYGYCEIAAELARWKVLPRDSTSHAHWTICMPKMVEILISSLYPGAHFMNINSKVATIIQHLGIANSDQKSDKVKKCVQFPDNVTQLAHILLLQSG